MDKLEALVALRDKVKAGNPSDPEFGRVWPPTGDEGWRHNRFAWKAYEGSIDAARALHDAVLGDGYVSDGYKWCMWGSGTVSVWHVIKGLHHVGDVSDPQKHASSPARAWLIAILEALIAQEPKP